jgi:hypothetical protein
MSSWPIVARSSRPDVPNGMSTARSSTVGEESVSKTVTSRSAKSGRSSPAGSVNVTLPPMNAICTWPLSSVPV